MRVLAVSHAYPRRSNQSHGIFVHRLHRALKDLGVDVEVVQRSDWSPPWPLSGALSAWSDARAAHRDFLPNVDSVTVHHPRTFWPRPSRFFRADPWGRAAESIATYCRRNRRLSSADIVLGHFMVPDGYHAVMLGRALDIPVVTMAWGDDLHAWPARRPDWRQQLQFVLNNADALVACSASMVADGNAWLDQPRHDWEVVYGGVDLERFSPNSPMPSDRRRQIWLRAIGDPLETSRVILTLGQATTDKGYRELLDAWKQVGRSAHGWRLVMGGSNGELNMPDEIAQRGLQPSAHWIGLCMPDEIPELLRASDAFVLASHNEGLSLSVLEALSTGLPTIATHVGGHAEVISSASEGWLVAPRDTSALTQALTELLSSLSERSRRSHGGRQAAERIGSPASNAQKLSAILERCVKARTQNGTREKRA